MRFLRIIVAGLIAIAAMVGVLLAAVVVFFTGLAAYVLQLFRVKAGPISAGRPSGPTRQPGMQTDDVIEVVTTKVPDEPVGR